MRRATQRPRRSEDGEGSSTESQCHMRELAGHPEVVGFVDHVVDQQYVVIDVSPKETAEEVGLGVFSLVFLLCAFDAALALSGGGRQYFCTSTSP